MRKWVAMKEYIDAHGEEGAIWNEERADYGVMTAEVRLAVARSKQHSDRSSQTREVNRE